MVRIGRVAVVLCSIACLEISAAARAADATTTPPSDPVQQSDWYFQRGLEAVKAKDFDSARLAFERSYALAPNDDILRNLAAAQMRSGRTLEGARNLVGFLRRNAELRADERDALRKWLAVADHDLGRFVLQSKRAGVTVFVDDVAVGVTPVLDVYYVKPGTHQVRAEVDGSTAFLKMIEAKAGEATSVLIEPEPSPATSAQESGQAKPAPLGRASEESPKPPARSADRTGALVTRTTVTLAFSTLAVLSGIAWVGFERAGNAASDDVARIRGDLLNNHGPLGCIDAGTSRCAELLDRASDVRRFDRYANAAGIGVAVGVLGAAGTWLLWPKSIPAKQASGIRPWFTGQSGGVQLDGRF